MQDYAYYVGILLEIYDSHARGVARGCGQTGKEIISRVGGYCSQLT